MPSAMLLIPWTPGFRVSSLLSGAFIAEFFFNWPGLGRLILQAVLAQDLYLVMAKPGNGCCDANCRQPVGIAAKV